MVQVVMPCDLEEWYCWERPETGHFRALWVLDEGDLLGFDKEMPSEEAAPGLEETAKSIGLAQRSAQARSRPFLLPGKPWHQSRGVETSAPGLFSF